jgi:colanic acid biosynthesis glycosyl transferase WcaI
MSFAVLSFPFLIRQIAWRPDVVLVIAPSFFSVPGALIISKISGAKSWLHIQDFELDAAYSLSILGNKKFRETVASVEKWLMCKFSNVSTISGTMLARAISKGIEPKRAVLFPNWINLQEVTPLRRPSVYRHELGIPDDAVVALYCGNMGGKQGLEILSAAARKLAHQKRLYFVFCGNGHQKDALIRSSEGLANVRFMDLQPADRLNELLGMGDIHLLPQKAEADGLVMPSKLIGMLASGRPIIATAGADSELGRTVAQCGITVPAGDESAFAEAILRLSGDATLRNKMGERGREFAEENLCMETILSEFMKRLVSAV